MSIATFTSKSFPDALISGLDVLLMMGSIVQADTSYRHVGPSDYS